MYIHVSTTTLVGVILSKLLLSMCTPSPPYPPLLFLPLPLLNFEQWVRVRVSTTLVILYLQSSKFPGLRWKRDYLAKNILSFELELLLIKKPIKSTLYYCHRDDLFINSLSKSFLHSFQWRKIHRGLGPKITKRTLNFP